MPGPPLKTRKVNADCTTSLVPNVDDPATVGTILIIRYFESLKYVTYVTGSLALKLAASLEAFELLHFTAQKLPLHLFDFTVKFKKLETATAKRKVEKSERKF
ncbi:hypothetical protein CHUAL_012814 [Chamberlinius hualienensis]